jgi:hypothetical protein
VSVKVVVAVTVLVMLPDVTGVTLPTPPLMLNEVAPVTLQARVTLPPPAGNVLGVAVKLAMAGAVVVGFVV